MVREESKGRGKELNMKRTVWLGIFIPLIIFLLSSCGISYHTQEVNRFIGQNETLLRSNYGNPWSVIYDSQGRKVLAFEQGFTRQVQTEGTSYTDSSGTVHYNPPSTRTERYVVHRIFTLDKDGKVVKAPWKEF
jgi:hypothetical protein